MEPVEGHPPMLAGDLLPRFLGGGFCLGFRFGFWFWLGHGGVVFLERHDGEFLFTHCADGEDGGFGGGEGCHDGESAFDGGASDDSFVLFGFAAEGRIDDPVDVSVDHAVDDVGASFADFVDGVDDDAVFEEGFGVSFGGHDAEAEVDEVFGECADVFAVVDVEA